MTIQEIYDDITFLLGAGSDSNNYTIPDRLRNINNRNQQVWQFIWDSYGGWAFRVDNFYFGVDVTSGSGSLTLPVNEDTGESLGLSIRDVEILDPGSGWRRLQPVTFEEWKRLGGSANSETASGDPVYGTPLYYLPDGTNNVKIFPIPSYTQESGARIYMDEAFFDFDEVTDRPIFARPFHRVLAIGAALDYAMARGMKDKVAYLSQMWNRYEQDIKSYYERRYIDVGIKGIQTIDPLSSYS